MSTDKRFIYFPSFSSIISQLKQNKIEIGSTKTIRFYDDAFPEKFIYKNFLITAAEGYNKKENLRDAIGLNNGSLVFGDSGGYQIATGKLKWDKSLPDKIFDFLINNSDIAMNLDIPPKQKWNNKFNECLNISKENFRYFEKRIAKENPTTKFLNVLQAETSELQYQTWYEKVNGFQFNGWGIGGTLTQHYNAIYAIALLLKKGELEKKSCEYIHFLGATSPFNFLLYAIIQKNFNKHFPHITVTTDSSTPLKQPVYGNYIYDIDLKKMQFTYHKMQRRSTIIYNVDLTPPCLNLNCPICNNITWRELINVRTLQERNIITGLHNLFILINKGVDNISSLVYNNALKGKVANEILEVEKSINQIFENPKKALDVFYKHKDLYKKISRHINVDKIDMGLDMNFEI